jgi:hypothetical protein
MNNKKCITQNIAFALFEVPTPNRIALKELSITIYPNGRSFTPYGTLELAKDLIRWAAAADDSVKEMVKNIDL